MDGFRVETTALANAGTKYITAGAALRDCAEQLHRVRSALDRQTIGADLQDVLRRVIIAADCAADETRALGLQCAKIAGTYDDTERQVVSALAALRATSAFAAGTAGDGAQAAERVISPLRPARPLPFSGNALPAEGWLLDRAIKASLEGRA